MAKYDPLNGHLRRQKAHRLELSFAEIERMLGSMRPKGAARPQWWGNEADPAERHVQRTGCLLLHLQGNGVVLDQRARRCGP